MRSGWVRSRKRFEWELALAPHLLPAASEPELCLQTRLSDLRVNYITPLHRHNRAQDYFLFITILILS
jgi:hypothetical protein